MFDAIATVLAWCYAITNNYALAIALLTLLVMVLLTPLTLKSTKSMLQMQRLQPEIRKLQAQYKNDRQQLNEELMKFYQENKINPVGGCLPLLLQTPVFMVLYRVLHKLTETCSSEADIAAGACTKIGNFKPSYIDHSSQLWKDLTATDRMMSFGIDLSHSAVRELSNSVVRGLPYLVLILLVVATSYIQQWQISSRSGASGAMNPQQQMLLRLMPALFAVISLTLPAGLVVYFLVSNSYRIAQQAYITRAFYRGENSPGAQARAAAAAAAADGVEAPPLFPKIGRKAKAAAAVEPGPVVPPSAKGQTGSKRVTPSSKPSSSKAPSSKSPSSKPSSSTPPGKGGTKAPPSKTPPSKPASAAKPPSSSTPSSPAAPPAKQPPKDAGTPPADSTGAPSGSTNGTAGTSANGNGTNGQSSSKGRPTPSRPTPRPIVPPTDDV